MASFIQQTSCFCWKSPRDIFQLNDPVTNVTYRTQSTEVCLTIWRCLFSSSSKADAQHSLHFYTCMYFNLWITHFSWTLCVCIGVVLSVCEDWEGVGGEIAPAFCCWSTLRDGLMLKCTKNTLPSVCLCVCHVFMHSNVCVLLVCSCLFLSTVLVSFNLGWNWPLKKAK